MTTLRKSLLASLIAGYVAAGSLAAFAQTPPAAPQKPDQAAMAARMKDRMAKRQDALHDQLKLNASQEAAWKTYVAKTTPGAPPARPDRAEWAKLPTPERMDRMLALTKEHEKRMEERVAATKEFYAALTPEQQKTFDGAFSRSWGPEGRHGHGPRGDRQMPPAGR